MCCTLLVHCLFESCWQVLNSKSDAIQILFPKMSTMGQGGRGHSQVRGEERTGRRRKWRAERDVRCEVWGLLSFCQVSLPPPDGVSRCETHRPSLASGDQEMSGEIIDFVCELSSVSAQLGVYHILMITGIGLWLVSSTLPLTDYWMRTCYCLLVAGGHRVISLSLLFVKLKHSSHW